MSEARDTGDRILLAARELFANRGYAGTTTRAIAEAAGVNEVTVFRRFENKQGVLRALGKQMALRQAGHAAAAGPDSESVRDTLLRLARMEIAGALEDGGFAIRLAFDARSVPEVAAVLGEGIPGNLTGLAEYMAEQQATRELRDDIDPSVMAEAFFGLTSSYVMYRMVMGVAELPADIETDQGIEQLFDIFWSGAAAQEGEKA
ncbi:MAG: TetR/AcrR family transcriptional regulator [Coriobacteriia bacterium]|nr:TetR/AcrR family transcriptional regulator [Coriobacteriia bacterium]MBN2821727.1 TetR/AcrR family transcriptional regulator [Coriobacteriia bacterium]